MKIHRQFMPCLAVAAALFVASAGAPAGAAGIQEREFTLGHVVGTNFPYHTSAEYMRDLMEEKTDGAWTMELFHSSALGGEHDHLEALQLGTVDFTWVHTVAIADLVPEFQLFNLPGVFRNAEHVEAALDTIDMEPFAEAAAEHGFKLIGISGPAMRYLMNSQRPIETPEDLSGLRVRTMNAEAHVATYDALGASVQSTEFAEVYGALQMGVVDGTENNPSALYTMNFHEVQEYLSMFPIVSNTAVLLSSQALWNDLNEEEQALMEEIIPQVIARAHADYYRLDNAAVEQMKEAGIKVNVVDDPQAFIDATEDVRDTFLADMDPWVRDTLEQIMAVEVDG